MTAILNSDGKIPVPVPVKSRYSLGHRRRVKSGFQKNFNDICIAKGKTISARRYWEWYLDAEDFVTHIIILDGKEMAQSIKLPEVGYAAFRRFLACDCDVQLEDSQHDTVQAIDGIYTLFRIHFSLDDEAV